jgi:hypothetical protein
VYRYGQQSVIRGSTAANWPDELAEASPAVALARFVKANTLAGAIDETFRVSFASIRVLNGTCWSHLRDLSSDFARKLR